MAAQGSQGEPKGGRPGTRLSGHGHGQRYAGCGCRLELPAYAFGRGRRQREETGLWVCGGLSLCALLCLVCEGLCLLSLVEGCVSAECIGHGQLCMACLRWRDE